MNNHQLPPSNANSSSTALSSPQESLNSRSCVTCRRRKVRCNKRSPCSNCIKAGIECVFPAPGRARRKSKRPQDAELLSRLRRLEGVIEQISGNRSEGSQNPQPQTPQPQATPSPVERNDDAGSHEQPQPKDVCPFMLENDPKDIKPQNIAHEFGRLVIDEGRSRYVSNRFWASLGDEIEELQDILDPTSSEDDDYPSPESASTYSASHDGFLLGFYSLSHSLRGFHPSPDKIPLLWENYSENVAPLISILHKPTAKKLFLETAKRPELLDKNSEALVFAMCLVTVVSMSPQQCLSQLGEERDTAVSRYRFAVEQALSKANFLNTQSLMLLQAAVLFLIGVRREDDSKFVWSMSAIVLRLAQGIGLHRDGTNFDLKPFETEMRRRLWWHICLLDIRSSEDHGTDAQIHERLYDTRLPLNVNDEDIWPDMKEAPTEREGCTDMTFTLVRCEITVFVRRVSYICPSGRFRFGNGQPSIEESTRMIHVINRRIEDRYIKHCDVTVPIYWVCATVARLILAKLWLVVHHPMTRQDRGINLSSLSRETLFMNSIEVIEFGRLLEANELTSKWGWQFRTNIQWHAVAFVLSELCVRPVCPLTDRAWMAMSLVYDEWENHVKHRKGMLWRPLSQLMKRASAFRAKQMAEMQAQFGPNSAQFQPSTTQARMQTPVEFQSLPCIHMPTVPEPPSTQPNETFDSAPDTGFEEIDLNKGSINMLRDIFPDTNFLADPNGSNPIQQPPTSASIMNPPLAIPDVSTLPGSSAECLPDTQLNWEEWDQVMRDFQMDVQQTQATHPMGNVSDWFV
ncbi:hypothetical protein ASPWEDRAFT_150702 [Aspergillus wentii DTO 134E9]|uniref:Zn(2)-C6 fungal-type domain-containing protein n=1 Tax=Aspergillus wentii DTO 134E9 TaxID=1073089 RepID=A0A1L9RX81_ASPWE|nr:uncharacterized protein ASPWEDRAFT_150702 [Aspergillus wentii DTO 134E9]KAI9931814.1 hypothetical protein MW887_010393 [Aspergillus wentii]OJJ39503.1 hypothetical protein ASPWEDRAFT_150702 [Aspergillus wentii DTO 134E9]